MDIYDNRYSFVANPSVITKVTGKFLLIMEQHGFFEESALPFMVEADLLRDERP